MFLSPVEHVRACDETILACRTVRPAIKRFLELFNWFIENVDAANEAAPPEQVSAFYDAMRSPHPHEPRYKYPLVRKEYAEREREYKQLSDSIERRVNEVIDRFEKLDAATRVDLLPLRWLIAGRSADASQLRADVEAGVRTLDEVERVAMNEKAAKQASQAEPVSRELESVAKSLPPSPTNGERVTPAVAKAVGSYLEAVRRQPALKNADLGDVYNWLTENNVSLDGERYDPPSRSSWERYLRDPSAKAFLQSGHR